VYKAAFFFLLIPIIGILSSFYIFEKYGGIQEVEEICSLTISQLQRIYESPNAVREFCTNDIGQLKILQTSSYISFIASIMLLVLFKVTSIYCGTNRDKNALIFPKLIPIAVLTIGIQVLVQGLILAYLSYIIPIHLAGSYFPIFTLFIGLGAAIGCVQVFSSLLTFFEKPKHNEVALLAEKEKYPQLWNHIEKISKKISAKSPENIIIGLDPTFYAISSHVRLIQSNITLKGETLFLSLPLMNLLTIEELDAVIGHELGHFKAKDTFYSTKFAPVYANLAKSIQNLSDSSTGATGLAKLPAILVLDAMYNSFAENIAAISRNREFEADKIGSQASSVNGLAYSLAKIVTFSNLWQQTIYENIKRLSKGKITVNLSEVFKDSASYNVSNRDIDEIIQETLPSIIKHPTDSHPPISERYNNLNFDISNIEKEKIMFQGNASENLLNNVKEIEEELTEFEHRIQVSLGVVIPEKGNESGAEVIIYSLAAAMIGADGRIENDEVRVAEELGAKLLEDFDRVDFRIYVDNLEKIPDFIKVAESCIGWEHETKLMIYKFLKEIADSDDDFDKKEQEMLIKLKDIWSLRLKD